MIEWAVSAGLFVSFPFFYHDINPLQQIDMFQYVSLYGNDISLFAGTDRTHFPVDPHEYWRPVSCGFDGLQGVDTENPDPHIKFVPGALRMKFHGYPAVGPDKEDNPWLLRLLWMSSQKSS